MKIPPGLSNKEQHRWIWLLLYALGVMAALVGCAGGGSGPALESGNQAVSAAAGPARGAGVLVTEAEIATLPDWQQGLLNDPGWNQPYIAPRTATEVPEPTWEMLREYLDNEAGKVGNIRPRLADQRTASWMELSAFQPQELTLQGEYDGVPKTATPAYGCNNDGSNGTEDGNAFEDVIRAGTKYQPHALEYVYNGLTEQNWFNRSGGSGNDAQSAVYQLFASTRDVEPFDWENYPGVSFEELTYRADLAPGIGPGGDCSAAEAFLVTGRIWKRFNTEVGPLPETGWNGYCYGYDILVAPSSPESGLLTSSGKADGRYQEFYCGDLGNCFGGGWIVSLESAASGCQFFDDEVVMAMDDGSPMYTSPIFGVLLKRWQQAQLATMAGPWDSWLGWPVAGPLFYNNSQPMLSSQGSYYIWGMWFERGFIWWVDYDQAEYPETPDEARVYLFTGTNVLCRDSGQYQALEPAVYYGGTAAWPAPSGEPRVSVVVDSWRRDPLNEWQPVELTEDNEYRFGVWSIADEIQLALHAHAWGGTPDADCGYDQYVWAFRDGTIFMGDEAGAQYVTHRYSQLGDDVDSTYTVRVQVTDSTGAVGYGDSFPIVIYQKHYQQPQSEVCVVRNHNSEHSANLVALLDDLDLILDDYVDFEYGPGIATDIASLDAKAVIWVRGGPGAPDEPVSTREWTSDEIDNLVALLDNGVDVLLMSQDHGWNSEEYPGYGWGNYYGWDENLLAQSIPAGEERFLWAMGMTEAAGVGMSRNYGFLKSSPRNLAVTGTVGGKFATDGYDNDGANAAERYNGENASGDIPVELSFGAPRQLVGYGMCSPLQPGIFAPGFSAGVNCSLPFEGNWDIAFFSGGSTRAPGHGFGTWPPPYDFSDQGGARLYWIGYPWAQTVVTNSAEGKMVGEQNRYMLLENILAWMEDPLFFQILPPG